MIVVRGRRYPARRPRGFTLMEVLVVLILVAIISGLLMQGFSYMLQLRQRITFYLHEQQKQELQAYWLRSLVAGLAPVPENETYQFSGKAGGLQGLTLAALSAPLGVPRYVDLSWRKKAGKWQLVYKSRRDESGVSWVLGEWFGEVGRFRYLDRGGQWHKQWPPANPTGYQLPVAVWIDIEREVGPLEWIIAIPGRRNPREILSFDKNAQT